MSAGSTHDERSPEAARGRLVLYFGVAPGVGKTYAMLEAARQARRQGVDVVVGQVETHGRSEIDELLEGLERVPARSAYARGKLVGEFDLEAALLRRPSLLVIDDLAHTNAPGSGHPRRWQDVLELLAAGIDVHSTLGVQDLEGLHDVVVQFTPFRTRELVPDLVFERADEVIFVDPPADELLARIRDGKVAIPEREAQAAAVMYRRANLLALRELAIRRVARRGGRENSIYRSESRVSPGTPSERILVCVDPGPLGPRLVRAAFRMATGLRAEWLALYVETPALALAGEEVRARITETLRLAESLGAEVVHVGGERIDREILGFARARGATRLLIGKPTRHRWRDRWRGSLVDALVRESGDIDVHVIAGDVAPHERAPARPPQGRASVAPYLWATAAAAVAAGALVGLRPFFVLSLDFIAVAAIASRFGRWPALLTAGLCVVASELLIHPRDAAILVGEHERWWLYGLLALLAVRIAGMTERSRRQSEAARVDERRLTALFLLSRELSQLSSEADIAACAIYHVKKTMAAQTVVLVPGSDGELAAIPGTDVELTADPSEYGVARWAFDHGPAGRGTETLPAAQAIYFPLTAAGRTIGVLGVAPVDPQSLANPAERQLLEAMTGSVALAMQRARLAEEAQQAVVRARQEEFRGLLLSSVRHDLRTPLASITGAASTILQSEDVLAPETRRDLLQMIYDEAERLGRHISNLLDMTRLEAGSVELRTDWVAVEEPIGAVLERLSSRLAGREVQVSIAPDLPLLPLDELLFGQLMHNLIDNACKHTPPGTPIRVTARVQDSRVVIEVADRGPGLPEGAEQAIFDKFVRGSEVRSHGFGLGLAICRGIATAHGGAIVAENRPVGGAVFRVSLPISAAPPVPGPEASMCDQKIVDGRLP